MAAARHLLVGAIGVSVIAIAFAAAADKAAAWFATVVGPHPYAALAIAPTGFVVCVLLTRHVFPGAQGSGIPQTIAAIHRPIRRRSRACSRCASRSARSHWPCSASLAALQRLPRHDLQRALVLAGGAARIAAAFNTPLAGIVFAIEELSHSFEARTSGTVFTAVIISGATTLALVGNYTYFGQTSVEIELGIAWIAVLACSLAGGLAGGLFSAALLLAARGVPGRLRAGRALPRGLRGMLRLGDRSARPVVGRPDLRHGLRAGAAASSRAAPIWSPRIRC